MVRYQTHLEDVGPAQIAGFFVGWPHPPSPAMHHRLLQNSDYLVLAVDVETGRVVGFISALSDGVLSVYIPLLEVLPAYRKQGIGAQLVRRMLAQIDHLYNVDLLCDRALQPFYARFGMEPASAMVLRKSMADMNQKDAVEHFS